MIGAGDDSGTATYVIGFLTLVFMTVSGFLGWLRWLISSERAARIDTDTSLAARQTVTDEKLNTLRDDVRGNYIQRTEVMGRFDRLDIKIDKLSESIHNRRE